MSAFGMIQLVAYAFTAFLCIIAARSAVKNGMRTDVRSWHIIAGGVAVLLLLQVFYFEELIGDLLRELLRESDAYRTRRGMQAALALIIVVAGLISVALFGLRNRTRRNAAQKWIDLAAFGLAGSVALVGLRTLSLHGLDRLLHGSLHLNWLLDLGLMGSIALSAVQYRRRSVSAVRLDTAHRTPTHRAERRNQDI